MNITLPPPVATYLEAETRNDSEALSTCFAADAVVRDEGRSIEGLDAIKAWKKASKAKYQYSVEPLSASQDAATVAMRARLAGKFPGSPIEVTYTFVLADDRIASLEIR
ncbi:MAG: nuclear transport factor 2 family protein [Steroidobacteraceae bacterium]